MRSTTASNTNTLPFTAAQRRSEPENSQDTLRELEERVVEAEERLRKHSEVLEFALEVSALAAATLTPTPTSSAARGAAEKHGHGEDMHAKKENMVENIIMRVEEFNIHRTTREASGTEKEDGKTKKKAMQLKEESSSAEFVDNAPSQEALDARMEAFTHNTKVFRKQVDSLGGREKEEGVRNEDAEENTEERRATTTMAERKKKKSVDFVAPKPTKKSQAAAMHQRHQHQNDGDDHLQPHYHGPVSYRSSSSVELLPTLSASLIAEVACLRKKLAAVVEEQH